MNIAALLLLAFVACAAWACLSSDWQEFDEQEQDRDDDENPYDGQNGI